MLSYLAIIGTAFLWTAMLAFGWYPCCCGIGNACCPGVSIPATLTATLTVTDCECYAGGSFTMTWNGSAWVGSLARIPCEDASTGLTSYTWTLSCVAGNWLLQTTALRIGSGVACDFAGHARDVSSTCSPFLEKWSGTMANVATFTDCPCNGDAWSIEIAP